MISNMSQYFVSHSSLTVIIKLKNLHFIIFAKKVLNTWYVSGTVLSPLQALCHFIFRIHTSSSEKTGAQRDSKVIPVVSGRTRVGIQVV